MITGKLANNRIIKKIIAFQAMPIYIALIAVVALLAHEMAWDLFGFYFLCVVSVFTLLFNPDTKPLIPSLIFLVFCVSIQNTPTVDMEFKEIYFLQPQILVQLVTLVSVLIVLIVLRFILTAQLRRALKKSSLLGGLIALSVGLILNGLFAKEYTILNLALGVAFAFLFLGIYVFFLSTVKWDSKSIDFFAWAMFIMGILVTLQMGFLYLRNEQLRETFEKHYVNLGWSISNSIAYILLISMPFGFYFMKKAKFSLPYYILTFAIFLAIIFTFSRGSLVVAVPLAIAGVVYVCFSARDKISTISASGVVLVAAVVMFILYREKIYEMLNFYIETGFDDRGRAELWEEGIKAFLTAPIFGVGQMYKFGEMFATFTWFHNNLLQFLVTGGIIGLATYVYHRVETMFLLFKKPTLGRIFIGISVAALLINSMFDVAMSMPHMILFYSMMLAFADLDYAHVCEKSNLTDTNVNVARVENSLKSEKFLPSEKKGKKSDGNKAKKAIFKSSEIKSKDNNNK